MGALGVLGGSCSCVCLIHALAMWLVKRQQAGESKKLFQEATGAFVRRTVFGAGVAKFVAWSVIFLPGSASLWNYDEHVFMVSLALTGIYEIVGSAFIDYWIARDRAEAVFDVWIGYL